MSELKKKYCDHCFDGNDDTVFPYYGLPPHTHQKGVLGGAEFTGELPENFQQDETSMGVYTHCLNCGADGLADEELPFI